MTFPCTLDRRDLQPHAVSERHPHEHGLLTRAAPSSSRQKPDRCDHAGLHEYQGRRVTTPNRVSGAYKLRATRSRLFSQCASRIHAESQRVAGMPLLAPGPVSLHDECDARVRGSLSRRCHETSWSGAHIVGVVPLGLLSFPGICQVGVRAGGIGSARRRSSRGGVCVSARGGRWGSAG